jgi:2-keto-4-pentenoate hydratase/2-oxohepta-3-ene-1,7-dioic acid hydratase in catechol pathway
MRYCRLQTEKGPQFAEVVERAGESWVERIIPPFEEDPFAAFTEENIDPYPLAKAKLLVPVVPSKIVCVGRNYREHASELGNEVPAEPILFFKPPSSLLDPGGAISLPPFSQRVDFEGELALVLGKKCSKIADSEDVWQYIRGYTIVNDVSARDLQKKDGQWARAKGCDTFCPTGPIVTDEVDPERGLSVQTRLNGKLLQDGNTKDFIFPIGYLLRYISAAMTLYPGDLISTGTPAGVAAMHSGDKVEVTVEGIGTLASTVA